MKNQINDNEPNSGGDFHITRRIELNFWRTCFFNAAGLLLAKLTTDSIQFENIFSFTLLVVLIWFLNWIMRPILVVFTLPFIIFTMGVGMLFINAVIIYFAARLVPGIVVGSYWAALWASFLVSVLSWSVAMARSERTIRAAFGKSRNRNDKDDDNNNNSDVIDV